ncbi:hypothetical protein J437_LFUL017903 [Ladona fulva]|uniref:Uncharacterized protein n=1 Tax=Ladona fulva TaxID=123851 RepID=A0A8K0KJ39_LADFU|nr:hypothetical protein J437_LFUL017903 [Ladona fulva]
MFVSSNGWPIVKGNQRSDENERGSGFRKLRRADRQRRKAFHGWLRRSTKHLPPSLHHAGRQGRGPREGKGLGRGCRFRGAAIGEEPSDVKGFVTKGEETGCRAEKKLSLLPRQSTASPIAASDRRAGPSSTNDRPTGDGVPGDAVNPPLGQRHCHPPPPR